MALPALATLPQSASIVSRFPLNEVSGNRADDVGAVTLVDGNTVTSDTGQFGEKAAKFTRATSEYFAGGDNFDFSTSGQDFTVSFWLNPSTNPTDGNTVGFLNKGSVGGANRQWAVYQYKDASNNIINFNTSATGSANNYDCEYNNAEAVWTGTWKLITVVLKNQASGYLKLFMDGVEKKSTAVTADFAVYNSAIDFYIGISGSQYYDGLMQDIVIWNKDLTVDEVGDLYDAYFAVNFIPKTSII
jgi:hypothetical protein